MIENAAACIILQARQSKHYVTFTDKEFEFVSSHPALSANEKLIWFNLVRKSLRDPNLSCAITHQQIAMMIGIKQDTAYRAVKRLKQFGFLQAQFDAELQITTYAITLPDEGLEAITNAPNRGFGKKSDTPPDKNPAPPGKKSGTPPDKNPILLINNNINNKHNIHNQPQAQQAIVNDADALVCEFESLQKEFQNFSLAERVRRINGHFTAEQMHIIHARINAKQKCIEIEENQRNEKPAISAQPLEKSKFIDFEFEGLQFLIEEKVKDKIIHVIPLLHQRKKIKGDAANKTLSSIMKEVLFYVTKAGCLTDKPVIQLKRYHIACKILQKGQWECPRGITREESTAREALWQTSKKNEIAGSLVMVEGK